MTLHDRESVQFAFLNFVTERGHLKYEDSHVVSRLQNLSIETLYTYVLFAILKILSLNSIIGISLRL